VVPLAATSPLPTGAGTAAPTRVDTAGIGQRVSLLPIGKTNFIGLAIDGTGALYVSEGSEVDNEGLSGGGAGGNVKTLWRFTWSDRKARPVFSDAVSSVEFSRDHSTLSYSYRNDTRTLAASRATAETPVDPSTGSRIVVRGLTATIDPMAEWRTMYSQAWQHEKQNFYDPTLHGLNIPKAEATYAQFLPGLATRSDFTYLLREMLSNVAVSHLSVSEPPTGRGPGGGGGGGAGVGDTAGRRPGTGVLGADLVADGGRYRIARIYRGDPWNATQSAPLAAAGLGVKEGDYLFAINGKPLRAPENFYRALEGTSGTKTRLTIASSASGVDSRDVTVTPAATDTDLRNYEWIQDNIRSVDRLSNGRVAYVYMPTTGSSGHTSFVRYYLAQSNKEALIIDERFNGGGDIADWLMALLSRRQLTGPAPLTGNMDSVTALRSWAAAGPKVMLTNEYAGSGGDIMPFIFRQAGLGTLIGTRTHGGTIGNALGGTLLDGGSVSAPRGAVTGMGEWGMEGVGVAPDVEVLMDARSVAEGRDPQLEAAVAHVLRELRIGPRVVYRRPPPIRPRRGNGLDAVTEPARPSAAGAPLPP
jgi:tricorn protease